MPTLLLLRHAKSAWDDPALADHDRPLNGRGRAAARSIGAWMAEHGFKPDRVLCSTAHRARETFDEVARSLGDDPDVRLTRSLYDASEADYLSIINRKADPVQSLLVIGHNPAIQSTAMRLAGKGRIDLRSAIAKKYPTACLAILDTMGRPFADLGPGDGRLDAVIRPRDLA